MVDTCHVTQYLQPPVLTVVGGRHSGEVDTFEELRPEGSVNVLYCTVQYS